MFIIIDLLTVVDNLTTRFWNSCEAGPHKIRAMTIAITNPAMIVPEILFNGFMII